MIEAEKEVELRKLEASATDDAYRICGRTEGRIHNMSVFGKWYG